MDFLIQIDELLRSMDKLVAMGDRNQEAGQDALEIVQSLQRVANSDDALDAVLSRMTILYLFGDEGREARKGQDGP